MGRQRVGNLRSEEKMEEESELEKFYGPWRSI